MHTTSPLCLSKEVICFPYYMHAKFQPEIARWINIHVSTAVCTYVMYVYVLFRSYRFRLCISNTESYQHNNFFLMFYSVFYIFIIFISALFGVEFVRYGKVKQRLFTWTSEIDMDILKRLFKVNIALETEVGLANYMHIRKPKFHGLTTFLDRVSQTAHIEKISFLST